MERADSGRWRSVVALVFANSLVASMASAQATASFRILVEDDFVGAGQLSADGARASYARASAEGSGAVAETATGLGVFGTGSGNGGVPPVISGDGQTLHGFVFEPFAAPFEELFSYDFPSDTKTTFPEPRVYTPQALDQDGGVSVGTQSGLGAVRYVGGLGTTPRALGSLPGGAATSSFARDVSADGLVIVGGSDSTASTGTASEAFRWEGGAMAGLGDLPGGDFSSFAAAISADGSTTVGVGTSAAGSRAVRFLGGSVLDLGLLDSGDASSRARDVSGNGAVVVGDSGGRAFVWDAVNGMRDLKVLLTSLGLDLTTIDLQSVSAISADGTRLLGEGRDFESFGGGAIVWTATIPAVPEPGTAVLLGLGLAGLASARRGRGRRALPDQRTD